MKGDDPIGKAIQDYKSGIKDGNILVSSDLAEDDVIPVSYLFRTEFPPLEKEAIKVAHGKVLDVGAGTGIHCKQLALQKNVTEVEAIDTSQGAVQYMVENGIKARQQDFFNLNRGKYDTLLFMMNGIGLVGKLENLPVFFDKAKQLLNEDGKIICDSTNVDYFYTDDEGAMWIDLNAKYKGEFKFKMSYKNHSTDWFDWLYIDYELLKEKAKEFGWNCKKIYTDSNDHSFLVELKIKK